VKMVFIAATLGSPGDSSRSARTVIFPNLE
jgi:hypothetical protein